MNNREYTHLGDGAYAHFTGYSVEIIVNDHRNEPVATIPLSGVDKLKDFKDQRERVHESIKALDLEEGDKVTYDPGYGDKEKGIVKTIEEPEFPFVVYDCAGNWERYEDYTAQRTPVVNLTKGWGDSYESE